MEIPITADLEKLIKEYIPKYFISVDATRLNIVVILETAGLNVNKITIRKRSDIDRVLNDISSAKADEVLITYRKECKFKIIRLIEEKFNPEIVEEEKLINHFQFNRQHLFREKQKLSLKYNSIKIITTAFIPVLYKFELSMKILYPSYSYLRVSEMNDS